MSLKLYEQSSQKNIISGYSDRVRLNIEGFQPNLVGTVLQLDLDNLNSMLWLLILGCFALLLLLIMINLFLIASAGGRGANSHTQTPGSNLGPKETKELKPDRCTCWGRTARRNHDDWKRLMYSRNTEFHFQNFFCFKISKEWEKVQMGFLLIAWFSFLGPIL